MKVKRCSLYVSIGFLSAFIFWTVLVRFVGVAPIGPNGSKVGLSSLNNLVKELIGSHLALYTLTDWLGLVPFAVALSFAVFGLLQWVKRKNILKVDRDILVLGFFYIVVFATYILFECVVINYRPILINGRLESSYPSSTTMLATCVIPTCIMQLNKRMKLCFLKRVLITTSVIFVGFMVIGRLVSGVHWFTDIVGGLLYSIGLIALYCFFSNR